LLSEETLFLSLRELGDRIRARQLSPVELTESYLARSSELGLKLNAYACLTRELALRQANTAEKEIAAGHYRGPLHGVPYAVKDLVAVEGYPTTWGARPYATQRLDFNAAVIERLNRAGAVLPPGVAEFAYPGGNRASAKSLRIGRLTNVWREMDPGLDSAVNSALKVLEKEGARISDVEIPDGPYEEAAELTILIEEASAFRDLIASGRCAKLADRVGQINGYASEEFSATDYLQVQRVRSLLQKQIDKLFDNFDVLATAGESSAAALLNAPPEEDSAGPIERRAPDGISSLCGLPAITVPCGFHKDKLPFGAQFIGRALNDRVVIEAAHRFQQHTDRHRQRPPIQ
jgi:Asp-tRNA(Asn)/Glu-tRNA(Gln) amidotransferase A subunit family amidase